jgi:hypothetical protein
LKLCVYGLERLENFPQDEPDHPNADNSQHLWLENRLGCVPEPPEKSTG